MSPNLTSPGSFPIPDDLKVLSCWGAHYSCSCGHLNSIMIPLPYFALPPWYCHLIRSPQNSFCQPDQWSKWFLKCLNGCHLGHRGLSSTVTQLFFPDSWRPLDSSELEAGEHFWKLLYFCHDPSRDNLKWSCVIILDNLNWSDFVVWSLFRHAV